MKTELDNMHIKLYRAVGKGKIGFTEHMDLNMAKLSLERAIELEEYEAAKVFKDFIDKQS